MKLILHSRYILLFIMLLSLLAPCSMAYAQEPDDKVKSLGEILNPKTEDENTNLSAKERGNLYFKRCMNTKSLAFDSEEKEILCACTSAKLENILTGAEFVHLYKDTKKGRDARMKVITYAYTECMDYTLKKKVYKDCRVLPLLKTIKYGKNHICKCAANHYENLIHDGAARLIMKGVTYSPMTLNPLEHYFTTGGYYSTLSQYTKVCRSQMLYDKHN